MFQARINRRNNHAVEMRKAQKRTTILQPHKATLPSLNTTSGNGSTNTANTADSSSSASPSGFSSRIPTTLQQVFLSSNRGNNVDKPPPMKVANRMFRTFWSKTFASVSASSNPNAKPDIPTTKSADNVSAPPSSAAANSVAAASSADITEISPQEYLDQTLSARGYSTTHYKTLNTAYYNKPTPFQQASYSRHIIDLIKTNNVTKFQQIMMSGISTNPCNTFGESSLHMVCRRGDATLLKILLSSDVKVELHVADDYGRTPLHDACWASEMATDVLNLILQENMTENIHMFYMEDARGSLPLSYVHKTQYGEWMQYIDTVKDQYWPIVTGASPVMNQLLVRQPPHTRPIIDPINALSIELATMVANGRLEPHEATVIKRTGADLSSDDATDCETLEEGEDSDDESEDDDSDYNSDSDEESSSEDEDVEMIQEMSTILYKQ